MIIFETLRWKNFLSTGNSWSEINFLDSKTSLIVGQNGAGKSTMLDALSFALFGRSHRNISKPQLVNSINKKGTVVEVTFKTSGQQWKVVRGIKPNTFEIWQNGKMINQSSHSKEYQKILEQNIVKLNHKSFHQIVVLGSSSFIPFMQLSATHRREVIEDLLDINVFSKMNLLLREKNSILRDKIKDIAYQIDLITNKIETQRKYIKDIKLLTEQNITEKKDKIDAAQKEIDELQKENATLSVDVENSQGPLEQELQKLRSKSNAIMQYSAQFKQQMGNVAKDAKFYEDNETCPTCSQDISEQLRQSKLESARAKARELQSAMGRATEESTTINQSMERISSELESVREKQSTIHSNNQAIARIQSEIRDLEDYISGSGVADLNQSKTDLDNYLADKNNKLDDKLKLLDQKSYNEVMSEMLKDSGIKTKIVKQYIPIINKFVNQYLQVLDFFVSFNLDESFSETIRSRHRDSFTYDSFSEGEKQRIDLALLFTWRLIAKMKNSVATNLLILDETFDSSLDHEGVENLMKIIYTLGDETNVYVISHKGDLLDGKFERKLEFVKEKNFSKLKG